MKEAFPFRRPIMVRLSKALCTTDGIDIIFLCRERTLTHFATSVLLLVAVYEVTENC